MVFYMLGNEMYSKAGFNDKTDMELSDFSKEFIISVIFQKKNTLATIFKLFNNYNRFKTFRSAIKTEK
jgi:hypothetical protein